MQTQRVIRAIVIFLILLTNVGCDQISKTLVRQAIDYNERILLNPYLMLTKVENPGAFLSLGDSLPPLVRIMLLSVIPLLVLAYAIYFLATRTNLSRTTLIAMCFVIGGGIGNIYDRIVHGSVTDFLHIDFVIFQTGIFNMADVSIMTGVLLIMAEMLMKKQTKDASTDTGIQN